LRSQVANHVVRNSPLVVGTKFSVDLLVHNIPSLVSILRQVNTLRNFTRTCHFMNIILPLTFTSSQRSLHFRFSDYFFCFSRVCHSSYILGSARFWCHHCRTVWLRTAINLLKPNDIYTCRTAALTSRLYILYIYSTNIHTEYFKHAA